MSDERSEVERYCPCCGRKARAGMVIGTLIMLRCRDCGFHWTEVVRPGIRPSASDITALPSEENR